jgi:hypothetical protein
MATVDIHSFATLASDAAEQRQRKEERSVVWAFFWTLFFFKIGTVVVILWAAGVSLEAGVLLTVTTWPFFVIPAVAVAGPITVFVRLRRMRSRRELLRRAEWMLD